LSAEARPNSQLRMTGTIATIFGAAALAVVLLSVFVMASRPWGCSASSESPTITCDWVTSRVVAAFWLIAALGLCAISCKGWKLPLAMISVPLLAISLISVIGVFSLAPAALWLANALWLWAKDRQSFSVVAALASIVLVYLAATGVLALRALHSAPI
jgi:hypothetical protein